VITMSKLADAMRRATRREVRPIGFGAATATKNPTMLVLARVATAADAAKAASGADAIITVKGDDIVKSAGGALWGTEAVTNDREAAKALVAGGADFLVFDDDATDASVLLVDDLGFVMRIGLDASDTFLRTVEGLPLDALLVPALDGALTVRRTLDLRRVSSFARKPLLVPVTPDIQPTALETLRDCGVIGVVVDGAAGAAALRPKIDGLAPRRRPKDGRSVTLATGTSPASVRIEEEDEDDED
jgi:hypothetical protein